MIETGDLFFFLYCAEREHLDHDEDGVVEEHVDMTDGSVLVIGEAECHDPTFDSEANCFESRAQAAIALDQIRNILLKGAVWARTNQQ